MPLMSCPTCDTAMQEVSRSGVQIDICPRCKGVWLDRGELEKLLGQVRQVESQYEHDLDDYDRKSGHKPQRKKSPLRDLFDIFD